MTNFYMICDCDNFFASCERVFNPSLRNKPIVILSNNDGCVVARSSEAKELGIKMCAPFYQVKDFIAANDISVFSSNYTLYGDMSHRVMSLLSEYSNFFWQYSIDEMFLAFPSTKSAEQLYELGKKIRKEVLKGTGIPITVGIATTKTLAKMASKYGKTYKGYNGVCMIDSEEKRVKALQKFPVGDVWGIGYRNVKKLNGYGINTAWDLLQKREEWIRKVLTVAGLRVAMELKGIDCINLDETPERQSICTSRSFPDNGVSDYSVLEEAIANFTAACSRKLKERECCCKLLTVFAYTSRFRLDLPYHFIHRTIELPVATNDRQELIGYALKVLKMEWEEGHFLYKKAGIIVEEIIPARAVQYNLFDEVNRSRQSTLAKTIDEINRKNGSDTVKIAVQGFDKSWHLKSEHISRQFTTNLKDIIKVN